MLLFIFMSFLLPLSLGVIVADAAAAAIAAA